MKVLLFCILTALAAPVAAFQCPTLASQGLSVKQQETLLRAFKAGIEDNLSYSLAAIAWQESSAGLFLENPSDPSSGVFQVLTRNALHYAGWEGTEENHQVMYEILKYDFNTSAKYAILNLKFWQRLHGQDWRKVWASYVAGYNWNSKAGNNYAKSILSKVRTIQKCGW